MRELAEEFVRKRRELHQIGRGKRVSGELRTLAVRYARWAQFQGQPLYLIARDLGVVRKALRRWLRASPPTPSMCEVVVSCLPAQEATTVTVVTPDGFRIEGLSTEAAVAVLESLR